MLALPIESRPYRPIGGARELFHSREPEIVMAGPAGTGKSVATLNKVHAVLCKYPHARGLLCRKTRESLSQTTLVSFEERVVPVGFVSADGPQRNQRQSYVYPNGSELVLGGLDKSTKIMSSEYDVIFVDEATELVESDWEHLVTRLRNGIMPYQQIVGCCNPSHPRHWLKKRADRGAAKMIHSRHHDNPMLWDAEHDDWTPAGRSYLDKLNRLTGADLLRLRDGLWAAAEGLVFREFDPSVHVIHMDCKPADFVELIGAMDFGFTHAGTLQVWGKDHDGRLYLVLEYYRTNRGIQWWVDRAKDVQQRFGVRTFICDSARPDHIAQLCDAGCNAIGAFKNRELGIQAVRDRLVKAGDGKPRLFLLDDALEDPDETLVEAKLPFCTAQEFDAYVWKTDSKNTITEETIKEHDHGIDSLRYLVAHVDNLEGGGVTFVHPSHGE